LRRIAQDVDCLGAGKPFSLAATGYHIQATDGHIRPVHDCLVDDRSWAIRCLIAATCQ
jgi:hypothetical protein